MFLNGAELAEVEQKLQPEQPAAEFSVITEK
jgi:hypothetical protein